jgi:alpha-tubulin suppressor-like RCC1 family protein
MTVGSKTLVDAVNNSIAGADQPLEILQLASVAKDFDQSMIKSVANSAALPSAAANKGRMIYLEDTCGYRWSDGEMWTKDFTSVLEPNLYGWGSNSSGGLGDNTTVSRSSPVSVVGGFTDWCQASAGGSHSLAVRANGSLWSWGSNANGRLGDNTVVSKSSPVSVVGGFTDWCQVSAGSVHSLGLRTNGTLWSWGCNTDGQLGDNTIVSKSSPVSVVGGFTDWCQASAGNSHSLAVRCNGTLWAWGDHADGQLGDSERIVISRSSPVLVAGGFTDWCQASAGGSHSLGLRINGTLWAWGLNASGQLGINAGLNRSSPVSVVGGFTDWCQASAGFRHSLAVRQNGTLWAWGCNADGQLGDDTTVSKSSPVSVVGGFTDWCQTSAGSSLSLAVRTNGTLWAWGRGLSGELGDNTTVAKSSPVSVVGGFTDWCQASAGSRGLALRASRGF